MDVNQKIARLALKRVQERLNDTAQPDPYESGETRDILGEDDRCFIFAPQADSDNWWEPFDFRKPGHMAAWRETRRTGRIAFLELETEPIR